MSVEKSKNQFHMVAQELNDLRLLDETEMFHGLLSYEKELTPLPQEERNEDNYVHGCISNAYVVLEEDENKKAKIRGHSDSMLVKGLMGVLALGFSCMSKTELAESGKELVQEFIEEIDINIMLTPTRANAFGNIIKKILERAKE